VPTKLLTSFEVLASPIAPGVPDVPYIQQGFFIQVTNLGSQNAFLALEYVASPGFIEAQGAIKLFTNIIDDAGLPQQYPAGAFLSAPVGYEALNIPAGATWLVGVQYLLLPPPPVQTSPLTGATPQDAFRTKGIIRATAAASTSWLFLATIRQVFSTFNAGGMVESDGSAYSVPIVGGPELVF